MAPHVCAPDLAAGDNASTHGIDSRDHCRSTGAVDGAPGPCLGEGVEDGDDLTQRPAEPGEFADNQTVAALEDVHQFVEPAALFGSLSRGGRRDEIVDAEVVFAGVLEDGEALAAHVPLRGRDPQIGNGFTV